MKIPTVALAAAAAAVLTACSGGGAESKPATTPRPVGHAPGYAPNRVVYTVTSNTADSGDITWSEPAEPNGTKPNADLPWTIEFNAADGERLDVTGSVLSGDVTCEIRVNGRLLTKTETHNVPAAQATCRVTIPSE